MSQQRLNKLRSAMGEQKVQATALIPGANLYYMTGVSFHLMERPIIVIFHVASPPVAVLPQLEADKFAAQVPFETEVFAYKDGEDPASAVRDAIGALPEIQKLAVEHLTMRVHELRLLQHRLPVAYIEQAQPVMDMLRLYKSDAEVDAMREAIRISEAALEEVLLAVRPDVTERDIATRLMLAQSRLGGGPTPFEPIVLFGERAALPHGTPSDQRLKADDLILVDFGTTHEGYLSDITRCFFYGSPDEKTREVYEVVRQANTAAQEKAAPGVTCQEVDRAARQVIEDAGYGEYFIHRTGHGIGLESHESPYIVEGNDQMLEPGMTFTIEPGIYIPGEFGVRIEDDMLVTEDSVTSLTRYTHDLREI